MSLLRTILLVVSGLALATVMALWIASGQIFSIVSFLVSAFLIANAIYVFYSRPVFESSKLLSKMAEGLAFASIELHYQAKEARIKEEEDNKRKSEEEKVRSYKMQAARDFLSFAQIKSSEGEKGLFDVAKITGPREAQPAPVPSLDKPRPLPASPFADHQSGVGEAKAEPPKSVTPPKTALPIGG